MERTMRCLSALLLSAAILLAWFGSGLAGTEVDAAPDRFSVPANLGGARIRGLGLGVSAVQEEAGKERRALAQRIGQILKPDAVTAYFGAGNLDQLKKTLAQGRDYPEPTTPSPPPAPPQRQGEATGLTLQQSVEIALYKNLDVRLVAIDRDTARLEVQKAKAKFHPSVGSTVSGSSTRTVVDQPPTISDETQAAQAVTGFIKQEVPTGATITLSSGLARTDTPAAVPAEQFSPGLTVTLVQPLFKGGRVFVATQLIKNAEFDLRTAEAKLRSQILKVTSDTKSAYYNVLLAEKVIGVIEAAIDRDRALIDASQALFQARLVTKRDVFSAELSLAQDSARLVSAHADRQTATNALLDVIGLPIATDVQLVDREIGFEPIPLELERWIETAIMNRPEIMDLEAKRAKRELTARVARNSLLPQLDFAASYGRAETSSLFKRSLDLRGDAWTVGLVYSFPLGNVAAKSALAQAELDQPRLREQLAQQKRQIELEVRSSEIKLRKSLERMKALTLAIEQAKGKLEVGKAQFALGQATNLDITDAQQAILSAETDLLGAIVDYNIGLAELEARTGGPLKLQ